MGNQIIIMQFRLKMDHFYGVSRNKNNKRRIKSKKNRKNNLKNKDLLTK
jgi:hypothetical protein